MKRINEIPLQVVLALFFLFLLPPKAVFAQLSWQQTNSEVDYPIYIFHGTADRVIPYTSAEKLKTILKAEDQFYTIQQGRHNNLNSFPEVQNALNTILQ